VYVVAWESLAVGAKQRKYRGIHGAMDAADKLRKLGRYYDVCAVEGKLRLKRRPRKSESVGEPHS